MAEICSNICLSGGIDGRCESGKGGIIEVAITNWSSDLYTIYDASGNVSSSDEFDPDHKKYVIAPTSGATCGGTAGWYKFTFRRNTGSMSSTLNIDETNGTNYVQTDLNLVFSRMEMEKRLEIVALCQTPSAMVVKDANGNYWALGVDEPVYASAGEGVTGTNRTDANQYSLTLTDYSTEFPLPVDPTNGENILAAATF